MRAVFCNVRRRHELTRQRENIPGEQVGALAAGVGRGRSLLHLPHRDGRRRGRQARLGHLRRGRSRSTSTRMAPVFDSEQQVRGAERGALPSPIPCGSRARPLPEPFAHPHASVLDPVRLIDSLLFRSLRSSFARWPSSLTTILPFKRAYSSCSSWGSGARAERWPRRGALAMRARERSVAFGGPGGGLSVLRVSVSAVCVTCDSETVHVLVIYMDLASAALSLSLGRALYCLQGKLSK